VPPQFLTSTSRFHEALFLLGVASPFCRHQHSFQKGDIILNLITFPMRGLRRHRETHNFSLMSLTPIAFDFNTFSCHDGSYFVTIAVVSYILRRPLNLVGLSTPKESVILLTCFIAYYSEYVPPQNCPLPLSRQPLRALQLSTSTHRFSYYTTPFFLSYMTRAWGMPALFVHSLFLHTSWKVGSYRFPSPSNGSLLILSLSLSLTMTLSVEETLMNFGYTYAPNLIHQGASVITEISSANGYRNLAASNSYEVTHGPKLPQNHFQKV
jgi:hypothetical protein